MSNYSVVGSGLYGATIARQLADTRESICVIDRRPNIVGNVFTKDIAGITVHIFRAHIFYANNETVWDYIQGFATQ